MNNTHPTFDNWIKDTHCGASCEAYRNGHRHGWHSHVYPSGTVACEGTFVAGRMEGHWVFFDVNGHLVHNIEFIAGQPNALSIEHVA